MNVRNASLLCTLAFAVAATAQEVPDSLNLIDNGGFEVLDGKVKRLGYFEEAHGWKSPTAKKADLFA